MTTEQQNRIEIGFIIATFLVCLFVVGFAGALAISIGGAVILHIVISLVETDDEQR